MTTTTNDAEREDALFVSLSEEEYARVQVPTKEEILAVLREGREQLRAASSGPKPGRVDSRLRFR